MRSRPEPPHVTMPSEVPSAWVSTKRVLRLPSSPDSPKTLADPYPTLMIRVRRGGCFVQLGATETRPGSAALISAADRRADTVIRTHARRARARGLLFWRTRRAAVHGTQRGTSSPLPRCLRACSPRRRASGWALGRVTMYESRVGVQLAEGIDLAATTPSSRAARPRQYRRPHGAVSSDGKARRDERTTQRLVSVYFDPVRCTALRPTRAVTMVAVRRDGSALDCEHRRRQRHEFDLDARRTVALLPPTQYEALPPLRAHSVLVEQHGEDVTIITTQKG